MIVDRKQQMVDSLWQTRKACADAIRKCELAEQQAKQAQDTAAHRRQAALADARQKHAQARQSAEAAWKQMRDLAQQADHILTDLKLTPGPLSSFVPPAGAGLDELARLLYNQRSQAQEALNRLKATATALKEERRKWWKFW